MLPGDRSLPLLRTSASGLADLARAGRLARVAAMHFLLFGGYLAMLGLLPRALVESGGSDLHCKVGSPPRIRVDGVLTRLGSEPLTAADTDAMVAEVMREDLVDRFAQTNDADFAYSIPGVGRVRVNAGDHPGEVGLTKAERGFVRSDAMDRPVDRMEMHRRVRGWQVRAILQVQLDRLVTQVGEEVALPVPLHTRRV